MVTISLLILSSLSLELVGLQSEFMVLIILSCSTIIASFAFESVLKTKSNENYTSLMQIKENFDTTVLKRTEFTLWWVSACVAFFGFYTTNVTIVCDFCCFFLINLNERSIKIFFIRTITQKRCFQNQIPKYST